LKPHIKLAPDARFQRAIVCGAPERAALIASQMEGSIELAKNREYHSYLGRHQGVDVMVMSHGVGAPGATICFQEMMDVGVKSIIRVGTAGGLQDESRIGDIAVATAAVRQDGTTAMMVPAGFPAVADAEVTAAIASAIKARGHRFHQGIVVTSDLFYPALVDGQLALFRDANCVAVEMECAALFVTGTLRKVRTGSLLALDGNPLRWTEGEYNPHGGSMDQAIRTAMGAALDAIVKF
jgi:uridine phosphorylase